MKPWPLAALLLASCGPLVQIGGGGPTPDALLVLRAPAMAPALVAGAPTRTLLVDPPAVPGTLRTLRLPVTVADTQVQYLKAASWVEPPARLFQRLLIDVVAQRGGTVALDSRQYTGSATRRLGGTLLELGLDTRGGSRARVRFDATLLGANGAILAVRRFETTEPVGAEDPATVGAALNVAANRLAVEVSDWAARS